MDYVGATCRMACIPIFGAKRMKHQSLPTAIGKPKKISTGSCIFFLTAWIGLLYSIVRFH
jgi:hypothetical protein